MPLQAGGSSIAVKTAASDPSREVVTYQVTVHTAPGRGSGTDAAVSLFLEGEHGTMEKVCPRLTCFAPDAAVSLFLKGEHGTKEKMRLCFPCTDAAVSFFLEGEHGTMRKARPSPCSPCTLVYPPLLGARPCCLLDASTAACVQVALLGEQNAFQPGQADTFLLPHRALGTLRNCTIFRDARGCSDPNWALRRVDVSVAPPAGSEASASGPVDTFWFCRTLRGAGEAEASAACAHGGANLPVLYTIRVFTSPLKGVSLPTALFCSLQLP